MKAISFDYDLVVGIGSGDVEGVEIPEALLSVPRAAMRYTGSAIIDARVAATFYVDDAGVKHIRQNSAGNWQKLVVSYDAELVKDGASWRPQIDAEALTKLKEALKQSIDTDAENIRLRYITAGSGQAMVYQQKNAEAEAFVKDMSPSPNPASYPILSASVGIEGATLQEVATMVLATRAQWSGVAALIEAARLGTKRNIEEASTPEAASAARADVVWP